MTTPEEIFELIDPTTPRWETITAIGRSWQDRLVNRDALAQRNQAPGRTRRIGRTHGQVSQDAPIGQREQEWQLWRGGLVLVRSEYTIGRETVTVVGQGPRWWRWSPVLGATSGGGAGRPVRLLLGPPAALIDPRRLFEQLEITVAGSATVAGRPAHRVRATPVAARGRARLALREAGTGADGYEITVDAERGMLLSVEAFVGERSFQRVEVTEITYDAVLSPTLFSPEQSSGEKFVKARQAQHLTLDVLVGTVDFTVYVPKSSPSTVPPYVALFDGDRRGFGPVHAVLTYAIADPSFGRGQLRITEAKSALLRSSRGEWAIKNGVEVSEERHGRVQRRRVRTEIDGTFVEIESAVMPIGELIEMARTLVRYTPGAEPFEGELSVGGELEPDQG